MNVICPEARIHACSGRTIIWIRLRESRLPAIYAPGVTDALECYPSAGRGPLLVQLAGLLGEGQLLEPLAPSLLLLHDAGAVAALAAGLAAEAVAGLLDALAAVAVVVAAVLTELQEECHGLLSEEC